MWPDFKYIPEAVYIIFLSCAHLQMQRSCRSTLLIFSSVAVEMVDHPQVCGGEDCWSWDGQKIRQNNRVTEGGSRRQEDSGDWRRKRRNQEHSEENRSQKRRSTLVCQCGRPVKSSILGNCGFLYTSIKTKLLVVGVAKEWKPAAAANAWTLFWSLNRKCSYETVNTRGDCQQIFWGVNVLN